MFPGSCSPQRSSKTGGNSHHRFLNTRVTEFNLPFKETYKTICSDARHNWEQIGEVFSSRRCVHHSCCTRGRGGFTTISTFPCAQQVHRRESYLENKINKEAKDRSQTKGRRREGKTWRKEREGRKRGRVRWRKEGSKWEKRRRWKKLHASSHTHTCVRPHEARICS